MVIRGNASRLRAADQLVRGNRVLTGELNIRRRCFQRLQQVPEKAFGESDFPGDAAATHPELDDLPNCEGAIKVVDTVPVFPKIRDEWSDEVWVRQRGKWVL